MSVFVIDNYDSFVYNIARYCEELGRCCTVQRAGEACLSTIRRAAPESIIISPGPCSPKEAENSMAAIKFFAGSIPILGVCLGHQCIGAAFGAHISHAKVPMHGRRSEITHSGQRLFAGLPQRLKVGLYHSLIVEEPPDQIINIDARSPEGEIMALSHQSLPIYGVQFHPESVLSDQGHAIFANFFALADCFYGQKNFKEMHSNAL